jgi:hypothetical protein
VDDAAKVGGGCSGAGGGGSVAGSSPSMVSSSGGWERWAELQQWTMAPKSVVAAAAPVAVDLLQAPPLPWFRAAVARSD